MSFLKVYFSLTLIEAGSGFHRRGGEGRGGCLAVLITLCWSLGGHGDFGSEKYLIMKKIWFGSVESKLRYKVSNMISWMGWVWVGWGLGLQTGLKDQLRLIKKF